MVQANSPKMKRRKGPPSATVHKGYKKE
ncbi:hypothetical protein ACHAWX_000096 [Stephanocyclus meneghinianus]